MYIVFYLLHEEPCNVDVANKPSLLFLFLLLLLLLLSKVVCLLFVPNKEE